MRPHTRGIRRLVPFLLMLLAGSPAGSAQDTQHDSNASSRWGANYFPDVPLITQDGEEVRFFTDLVAGKVVVINFIYTSCPDSCPLETGRLLEVQGILGDRVGRDVFFYSISIDPEVDTPEVLKRYAKSYQVGPGWTFLTGDEDDITLLRKRLGLYIDEIQGEDSNDHNLSLIIGNQATGRWMKRSPFENPYVLSAQIGSWLHSWTDATGNDDDYASAPQLRDVSKAEILFRTRCAVCHTIGPGDGIFRAGPNLLGVMERRERDWIERWLAAPDEMLAAGDPIATELFEAYNGVEMPNLRLNQLEIDYLLDYIGSESRRVAAQLKVEEIDALREPPAEGASCCEKPDDGVLSAADATEDDGSDGRATDEDERPLATAGVTSGLSGLATHLSAGSWISMGLGVALGVAVLVLRLRQPRATA